MPAGAASEVSSAAQMIKEILPDMGRKGGIFFSLS